LLIQINFPKFTAQIVKQMMHPYTNTACLAVSAPVEAGKGLMPLSLNVAMGGGKSLTDNKLQGALAVFGCNGLRLCCGFFVFTGFSSSSQQKVSNNIRLIQIF